MSISIVKGTRTVLKFKVSIGSAFKNEPVNLGDFIDFRCRVTDGSRTLIEKRYSRNSIKIDGGKLAVTFEPSDTIGLFINPKSEEKWRTISLHGVNKDGSPERFFSTEFYLEHGDE